jgi:hypothetical protein
LSALQLLYNHFGSLLLQKFEKNLVEQGNPEMFPRRNALLRDVAHRQAPDRAPAPLAGPGHRGTAATAGPTAPAPTSARPVPHGHAPHTHGPSEPTRAAQPTTSPQYSARRPPLAATEPSMPSDQSRRQRTPSTTHAHPPVVLSSPPRLTVYKTEPLPAPRARHRATDAIGTDAVELRSTLVSNTA